MLRAEAMDEDQEPKSESKSKSKPDSADRVDSAREIPTLPPPKPFQAAAENATYGGGLSREKFESKNKHKRKRKDPSSQLRPASKHLFSKILVTLLIAAILLVTVLLYIGPGRFVAKGYRIVNLGATPDIIIAAPTSPTCYLSSGTIRYQVPITQTSVAFIAREIIVEGDFYEQTSLTALKIAASSKARFAKDLELYAIEFLNGGITLKGQISGWHDDNAGISPGAQP